MTTPSTPYPQDNDTKKLATHRQQTSQDSSTPHSLKHALVLEGGALRGIYTAGVLDVIMEEGLSFDVLYGVSAGALNALSFLSNQPGRSARISLKYIEDPRYMGDDNLQRTGDYFGFDFFSGDLSQTLDPLDFEIIQTNPTIFYSVVTELETGKAVYLEKSSTDVMKAAIASSSLPLIARAKEIDGVLYMDGGLACPIPFQRALEEGAQKVIVITTREKGFRKTKKTDEQILLEREHYAEYPAFVRLLERTVNIYNEQLDELEMLTAKGTVFTVSPKGPIDIGLKETSADKLAALYEEGRKDMEMCLDALKEYLYSSPGK